ncbi:aminodeoxychorismate lyase [Gallaecimonas sp. GXIMD4217]|uniref:aminodeoxychorismate lyase n=1 Tax=Gallaecimonas sp. GXIMD4217 TaxID=3131927 RepID=UPI00311AD25A
MTQAHLDDRLLNYGDGHFTTLKVSGGKPLHWPRHLARLQEGCARLAMAPLNWQQLSDEVAELARKQGQGGIKVLVSRGRGGRGYRPDAAMASHYWLKAFDGPAHYPQWQQQGIRVDILPVRLGHQPLLAGLKHCNRLEQVLASQCLESLRLDEGICLDQAGMLRSAVSANLFWSKGGRLFTPGLILAGVAGIMRDLVMAQRPVDQVDAGPEALAEADEIFLTNALMGVVPIRQLADRALASGPVTRALQEELNENTP